MKNIVATLASATVLLAGSVSLTHCAGGIATNINAAGVDPAALAHESRQALQSLYRTNPAAKASEPGPRASSSSRKSPKAASWSAPWAATARSSAPTARSRISIKPAGLSYGFQAGIQEYGYALFLMDDAAIRALNSTGWLGRRLQPQPRRRGQGHGRIHLHHHHEQRHLCLLLQSTGPDGWCRTRRHQDNPDPPETLTSKLSNQAFRP